MARPSKLNEQLISDMAAEIAAGLPVNYACDLFSINEQSYYNWFHQGEEDSANGLDTLHALFFVSIKKAYAEFVKDSLSRIRNGVSGWQGTAWWLERTNNKFMPKQQIQADEDGKVNVIIGGKVKDIQKK